MTDDRRVRRTFLPALALLALTLLVFEQTTLDLRLQDHFYDALTARWLIGAADPLPRLLFYTGPKFLLYLCGGVIGLVCLGPAALRGRFMADEGTRRRWLVVFATLATAPLLVASLKASTNVFCPSELTRYGGKEAYQPVFKRYTDADRPQKPGRGFPAGHASGGFSLVALAGIGPTRRRRLAGLTVGLVAGTAMGTYQMLKGAHFLSHTLVTALLCWLVFIAWHRVIVGGESFRVVRDPGACHPAPR